MIPLQQRLAQLSSAEDFLQFFGIDHDAHVVHVYRLHILKRFHDYLRQAPADADEATQYSIYKELLSRAYQDFVASDARTEKVFKVFRQAEGTQFVSLESLRAGLHGGDADHETALSN